MPPTIIFPTWKASLSEKKLDELSDKFEEIKKQQFGVDSFENASKQNGVIEQSLGLSGLAQFTASLPPN